MISASLMLHGAEIHVYSRLEGSCRLTSVLFFSGFTTRGFVGFSRYLKPPSEKSSR